MTIFQAIILGILFCFCRMGILYTWPKKYCSFWSLAYWDRFRRCTTGNDYWGCDPSFIYCGYSTGR